MSARRAAVLRALGATACEAEELLRYNANGFTVPSLPPLPLPDEPFVAVWDEYRAEARRRGVVPVLRERLRQLRFPIAPGMSETPAYRLATRRGVAPAAGGEELPIEAPERVHLWVHPTPAGRIPVILLEHRADFLAVLRALTRRNEPAEVPDAQGAAMVWSYNNWDRVDRLRAAFERGELALAGGWSDAFAVLRERRELYQDSFILLADGPYSGVRAEELGLGEEAWRHLSRVIRLEHECAHYFTRRVFGAAGQGMLDELMADYAGITAACGRFNAAWFLRFMGLEHPAAYRPGGRLERYRGTLSDGAFAVLQRLVRRAARTVEAVDHAAAAGPDGARRRLALLASLATFTFEELAADGAAGQLRERLWAREKPAVLLAG